MQSAWLRKLAKTKKRGNLRFSRHPLIIPSIEKDLISGKPWPKGRNSQGRLYFLAPNRALGRVLKKAPRLAPRAANGAFRGTVQKKDGGSRRAERA